jgi:predicted AAA+ superfamily ATPase
LLGGPRQCGKTMLANALNSTDTSYLTDIAKSQRLDAMRSLIGVLAAWSGKFMYISAIGSGLSIRRPTIESYLNAWTQYT